MFLEGLPRDKLELARKVGRTEIAVVGNLLQRQRLGVVQRDIFQRTLNVGAVALLVGHGFIAEDAITQQKQQQVQRFQLEDIL